MPSISQWLPQLTVVMTVLALVSALAAGFAIHRLMALTQQIRRMTGGDASGSLATQLERHQVEREAANATLQDHAARLKVLEDKMQTSKRFIGLVRYDAFMEVGGEQSFALAVFDELGDGVMLNGVVGRADARVFCKPLLRGRSDRSLSQEEERAIEEAVGKRSRAVISS